MQKALKANARRVLITTLLLFALSMAVVSVFFLTSGSDFVAAVLTRVLGRTVQIESIDVRFGTSFKIEVEGLRVLQKNQMPEAGTAAFEVRRALASQSWPRLFAGQFLPPNWTLEEPILRIQSDGATTSPFRLGFPLNTLSIRNGTVEWQQARGAPVFLRNVQLGARRSRLSSTLDGKGTADVTRGQKPVGQAAFLLTSASDDLQIHARVIRLDLPALPMGDLPLSRGQAEGLLTLRFRDGGLEGSADLSVADLDLRPASFRRPITPNDVRVKGQGSWRNGTLHLKPDPLKIDDLAISGELFVTSGTSPRIRGSLALSAFEAGRPDTRLQLLRLMGLRYATWERIDRRAEGGWIEDFNITLDLPLKDLGDALAFRRKLRPEELNGSALVKEGIFRSRPTATPLEGISARVYLRGNLLEIQELRISRNGKPLPKIDISIDGMHRLVRLPKAERGTPPGPGVPLPGLGAIFSERQADPNRPPIRLHLVDCHVAYPAFVLPFRDVTGWLSFPGGGLALEDAEGVLGGAPALVNASWDRGNKYIRVAVTYRDGEAPPLSPPELEELKTEWFGGRYQMEEAKLYRWPIRNLEGSLRIIGDQVTLEEARANSSQGKLTFAGSVSLAEENRAPLHIELELEGADASRVGDPLGLGSNRITGQAWIRGTSDGLLEPDHSFLENANMSLELKLEDGTLQNLPATMALARLPSLRGVRALFGQPLPYTSITSTLTIDQGQMKMQDFLLRGPELKITAAGKMDLLSPRQPADFLIALLLLQTVDWMIEGLPIVRDLVLGKDRSLVTVYIRLEGPRDDLRARLVPPETIRVTTDVTARIVRRGVSELRRLVGF
jgi:hypothetical protein